MTRFGIGDTVRVKDGTSKHYEGAVGTVEVVYPEDEDGPEGVYVLIEKVGRPLLFLADELEKVQPGEVGLRWVYVLKEAGNISRVKLEPGEKIVSVEGREEDHLCVWIQSEV